MRFSQFRIELDRLGQIPGGLAFETIRGNRCQPEISFGARGVLLERFAEQPAGIVVVEALVQQHSPSHLVQIFAARRLRHHAELFVRALPFLEPPEAFGAEVGVAAVCQRLEAALRLRRMSMLAQRPAVCWCRGTDGYSPCQRENRNDRGEPHLSSCSCTFASSTNASVNCFL